ncbi:MAG: PilN domain-containing protein [Candidatus Omnitrophota bacterium]
MLKTISYITKQNFKIVLFNITTDSLQVVKEKSFALKNGMIDFIPIIDFLKKEGLLNVHIVSCLFRYQVGARFFSFPSPDEKEIAKMVNFESAELLPLKPEEIVMRYSVLNKNNSGYSDTFVVVVPKEEVRQFVEKFQKTQLDIDILSLSSLAIFNCVKKVAESKNGIGLKNNTMVVYFEDNIIEVIIIKNKKLEFSRGFLVNDNKNFFQVLISEIRHSIELFFSNLELKKLEKIIVCGVNIDLKKIADTLAAIFEIPVSVNQKINIAYGLALDDENRINLLSDEIIAKKIKEKLKKKLIICGLILLVNMILAAAVFFVSLNNKKAYMAKMDEEILKLRPQAQEIQNKIQKLEMVEMQLSSQALILNAITDLANVTSSACTLNMLSINEQGQLLVRGQTKNLQDVLDFVSAIEKSAHFKNSHLNYSSRRKIKNQEVIDFEIQADLDENPN